MGIFSMIGGKLSDYLDRKVDKSEIKTTVDNAHFKLVFKEIALYTAVSYIANTISKCEFKVYEGGKEVQNRLYYMLNVNPNPNQTASEFKNAIIENYFYEGGALVIPRIDELFVASSYQKEIKGFDEHIFDNVVIDDLTLTQKYVMGDVFYFKLDNVNVKTLIDRMYTGYAEVLSLAMQAYGRANGQKYKIKIDRQKVGTLDFNSDTQKQCVSGLMIS